MNKRLLPVASVFAACLLIAAGWVISQGNMEFLAYIGFLLVLAGAVWWVDRRIVLPLALLWCLLAWAAAHLAGGLVPIPDSWSREGATAVLYNLWLLPGWLKFDQLVHTFGFGATTWLCWEGLRAMLAARGAPPRPTLGMLTLAVAAGTGFGAMNEIVEFIVTLLVPENNVGGYVNTALDLVFNLLGAVIAAVLIRWRAGTAS